MNTLQDDEKLKLQEKLGRKIRQYKNLTEMVRDAALESAALDQCEETVTLREAYNKRKKEIDEINDQVRTLSAQAKKIKKEIDEIQDILCPKRKRKRKNDKNENDTKEKGV